VQLNREREREFGSFKWRRVMKMEAWIEESLLTGCYPKLFKGRVTVTLTYVISDFTDFTNFSGNV